MANEELKTSEQGLEFIKTHEGCRDSVYLCPAGVKTVGIGHTGPEINALEVGFKVSEEDILTWLKEDVYEAEQAIKTYVETDLTQAQFDALVSFIFNVGTNAFRRSTLLKKINAEDFTGAEDEFSRWIYADGRPLAGLVTRRGAEQELFSGGSYDQTA